MLTTQPTLVAFHGQPAIKDEYVARVEAHRAAGGLSRGPTNGRDAGPDHVESSRWHGNAIGCLVHENNNPYGAAEGQLGVPRVLARLLNEFFKRMTPERQTTWPGQFLQAIPVGADLAGVWPQLALWLLVGEAGVLRFAQTDSQRAAIQKVANLYQSVLAGEEVPRYTWLEAGEAARNAAVPGHLAAMMALFADADTPIRGATYADAHAPATTILNANIDLVHAFGSALAASNAVDTADSLATHVATDAARDTDAASAAAALTDAPVVVGAAAHYIAGLYAASCPRKGAYRNFVADASAVYYDDLADKLLALLAATPVPAGLANGQNSVS